MFLDSRTVWSLNKLPYFHGHFVLFNQTWKRARGKISSTLVMPLRGFPDDDDDDDDNDDE